jgi:outer membrane protein OmpA-like peptidoglycan-associated protein
MNRAEICDGVTSDRTRRREARSRRGSSLRTALVFLPLGACALFGVRPPPDPDLMHGIEVVVSDLARQIGPAPEGTRTLAIDPLLDGRTGQQTHACERVQELLADALGTIIKGLKVLPFNGSGASSARLIVTGTIAVLPEPNRYRLSVALADRQTGIVVGQAATPFREPGLDLSPTKFYGDSPSLVKDRSIDGYLRTAETPVGSPADPLYIEQIPTSALLANALAAYNAERWDEALSLYNSAVERKDGQQLRTYNGIYLTETRLGHHKEAEEAFGRIAALGIATNNLAVKLLFRPGSTDFWPDPKVSAVYPMWLRQIAGAVQSAGSCLNIVGHTSRTGSEQFNDRLSLARATVVRDQLEHDVSGFTRKAQVSGVGYRENLVGTGVDDASDALDRRVEFRVVGCGS